MKRYYEPWWDENEKIWWVEYHSKPFYIWYKKCEEQGLEGFKEFIEYSKQTVKYYLKGLYDSEGYNYRNKLIFISNSNIELLRYVQYLLKEYFSIIATGPYLQKEAGNTRVIKEVEYLCNQDYYSIQIGREKHVQNFLREIGFTIVRRQLELKNMRKYL